MAFRHSSVSLVFILVWLAAASAFGQPVEGTATQNPGLETAAPTLAVEPVDPIDDPWLSEQGPAVAKPIEVAREQVAFAWSEAPEAAYARAAAVRRVRLELGLGDLVAPARVILSQATHEDLDIYTAFAEDLAPNTPSIHIAHVRALLSDGDVGGAIRGVGHLFMSVAFGLSSQLWLIENLTFTLMIVMLAAALGFISLSALQVYRHAAHDLGDLLGGRRTPVFAGIAGLACLLLAPLVVGEGVIGLALALFILAFAYAKSAQRNVLVMAAIMLLIALYPMARLVSIATSLVDQDPVGDSVMSVVAGTETLADVERLESVAETDPVASHALAYRARRYGREEFSRTQLEALGDRHPSDGFVLAALGNIKMRRGETDQAIGFYERAAPQLDSATLLFDLSQAYARAFRMEEYEQTIERAQSIDSGAVEALSSLGDSNLVADLVFPSHLLRDRFISSAMSRNEQFDLAATLAPGRLGGNWILTASAFALSVLCCMLFANRFDHSSQCVRCGHRICTRCEETVWSEELCEGCHHLFQSPEATDPSLRMARLQALAKREVKIDRAVLLTSLFVPGAAGLASRRPDLAMFGLLLFVWIALWLTWPTGVFEDPFLMGNAAVLCLAIPGVLAIVSYVAVIVASLIVRKKA